MGVHEKRPGATCYNNHDDTTTPTSIPNIAGKLDNPIGISVLLHSI